MGGADHRGRGLQRREAAGSAATMGARAAPLDEDARADCLPHRVALHGDGQAAAPLAQTGAVERRGAHLELRPMQRIPDYEEHAPVFGEPLIAIDLETESRPQWRPPGSILVGLDQRGRTPPAHEDYDLLLTTAADPPRIWVSTGGSTIDSELAKLRERVRQRPVAAATLAQALPAGAQLCFSDALAVESFAYSMLLGGAE